MSLALGHFCVLVHFNPNKCPIYYKIHNVYIIMSVHIYMYVCVCMCVCLYVCVCVFVCDPT